MLGTRDPALRGWMSWWTVGSFCLHGLLLLGIVILAVPRPIADESRLRVRLVEERAAPASIAPAPEKPRPSRSEALPRPIPKTPAQAPSPPPVPALPEATGTSPIAAPPEPAEVSAPAADGVGVPPAQGVGPVPKSERVASEASPLGAGGEGRSGSAPETPHSGTSFLAGPAGAGSGLGGPGSGGRGSGGPGGSPGGGPAVAGRGAAGAGAGTGGASLAGVLRSIRTKIEQARIYPEAARREGIQGTVDLRFRIAADGSVEAMEILRSSGHRILDEASEQTIRRAAPYPRVPGWVRLPLSYRLDR
ncbi:MAG: energy transducer TonB [candidate division NC10 bacterium]|nr:energy transducer TonB [candidate division NC10 bacterium]